MAERSKAWACGHSNVEIESSNPAGALDVYCLCCVLSGRGVCDGPITRPEEFYQVWCVWLWSRNLKNVAALAHWNCRAIKKKGTKTLLITVIKIFSFKNLLRGWLFVPLFAVNINRFENTFSSEQTYTRLINVWWKNGNIVLWTKLVIAKKLRLEFTSAIEIRGHTS